MVFDDAHVMKAALMGAAHWHEALIALPWDTARLQSLAQSAGLRRPHGAKKKGSRWTTRFDFWKSFSCSPMFANKDPEARTIETLEMISYQLYDRRSIFGSLLKSISLTVWPSVSWHEKHKNLPKGKNRSSFHIVGGPWGNPGGPKPINSVKPPMRLQDNRISVHQPWNYLVKGSGFFCFYVSLSPKLVITLNIPLAS